MMSTPPSQDETATKILLVIDVQSCLFRGPNALPEAPALTEKISDVLARARGTKGRVKSKASFFFTSRFSVYSLLYNSLYFYKI